MDWQSHFFISGTDAARFFRNTVFEDALEFIIAGATAIQVGTANFVNPRATIDIVDGIEAWMRQNSIERVSDLIGTLDTG